MSVSAIVLLAASIAAVVAVLTMAWKLHQLGKEEGRDSVFSEQLHNNAAKLKALSKPLPNRSDMVKWMRRRLPDKE